ncbi:MAG TPA: neuraminidase-like domain-containing protein [Bryobacteraceae bacterium]
MHGRITAQGGAPWSGGVTVFQQHIRKQTALGQGQTAADGSYSIRYAVPPDAPDPLLIVVQAAMQPVLTSPLFEAAADLEVNLSVDTPDLSEWTTVNASMTKLLEGLAVPDLVENGDHQDITFLSRELRKGTEDVMRLVVATRLGNAFKVPPAAFYGFLRQAIPSALPRPLLDASDSFTLIDALVHQIASMIFSLSADVQQRALTSAVQANLIGPQFTAQIPKIVSELQALRTTDLLAQPYLVGKTTLGQLLNTVKLPAEKQQVFAQVLASNTLSMRTFWKTLGDGKHGLTAAEASQIERTLSVGAFVKNHLPLVSVLLAGFDKAQYKALPDLARLSLKDWETLVTQTGPPPSIDGAGDANPAQVFAGVIYARITRAYPTAALSSRVAGSKFVPQAVQTPVNRFFTNNPTLELQKHNLAVFVAAAGDQAFAGIDAADRPAVTQQARQFQRVLRIAPQVDSAVTLLNLGIHSATQIATMGQQQFFVKATAAGITKHDAVRIYRAGAQRYAASLSLYTQLNRDAIGIWPAAIGQTAALDQPMSAAVERDQSLATLFGSQDYCAVDDCTSVLSPAAYLCDLLLWLRNHPQGSQTALDVLDARRPDIRHLLLNCPNTDTEVPYVDLVIELLGDAIAPPADPNSTINPQWKQTSEGKTAAELRAAPEYFNQGAFDAVATASYPHTLPYSAGLDAVRTYLQQWNIPVWQVRQALLTAPVSVAAERLGMSPHEQVLVTNANFVAAAVAWNTPAPATDLAPVEKFTQAASITYELILELLESAWVQGGLGIAIQGIADTCDTSVQSLAPAPLDAGFLDRAHRFLRLWRRTGYKMWELDLLLRAPAVANGALDGNALAGLQSFWQLQYVTGLAVDRQLAFYQDIDTATHRDSDGTTTTSLYSQLFLSPSVAADPDLAALPAGGAIVNPNLPDHLAGIQAALGVSADDATALFALTDGKLTLDNLSLLYRASALAKACRIAIGDLISLAVLITPGTADIITPLFANIAATLAFIDQVKSAQQSGFSIDALTYLLTPSPWATTTQMTADDITAALGAVRQAILNPSGGDVNGSVIAAVAANAHRPADSVIANDVTAAVVQAVQVPLTGKTILAVLTDPSMGSSTPIDAASFPNQFLAIQLFDKIAAIVRRLRLVSADVTWLLANPAVYGGVDLAQLPVTNAQPALSLGPVLTTMLVIKLARLFTAAAPQDTIQTLFDVISGVQAGTLANEAAAQTALAGISGWPIDNISAFAARLGIAFPADYKNPKTYDSLRTLQAMATAANATAAQIIEWGQIPADEATAQTMASSALGAVKAQHPDNQDWLKFAPTLTDPIRDRRSGALQAFLIAERDSSGNLIYGDVNGLFDHFLIDVEMSSCQVTSRVVQAYIAVQIFVERCLMNLEAPAVSVDPALDDTWNQWEWMKRYRIWEANREVFLYPENWLIESQRPNRTEIYQTFEQGVHQGESTTDYLETVALKYIDGLDGVSHLTVTGTCEDPATHSIHVVGRGVSDPPVFYLRSLENGAWTGWKQIPLSIKAKQVVPAVYRGRVCLFWLEVQVLNEPQQQLPEAQAGITPDQNVERYTALGVSFSIFRNGSWAPPQAAKGRLFDRPAISSSGVTDPASVEAFYTIKVQTPAPAPGYGASLFVDVFRFGYWQAYPYVMGTIDLVGPYGDAAIHLGRAVFDGRFNDLELRNTEVPLHGTYGIGMPLFTHAQSTYGPDAQPLLPLQDSQADPDFRGEPGLAPKAGALETLPPDPTSINPTLPLVFTSSGALQQNVGPLLNAAPVPFRVVGSTSDLEFDPAGYFFFQDNRRCYYVESQKVYWVGSAWTPVPPSNAGSVPFQVRYFFHRFYHPFTRLFWHQLSSGGFPLLYDRNLQLNPDQIDPSGADHFSFQTGYQPVLSRVDFDRDDVTNADREFLDFRFDASYSVYNWELFFHIPLYIAELLSQNQQFEDAAKWFHYIFDPTRAGTDPAPKRFWIPKPIYDLTSADILAQRINNLLEAVNLGDANAINQVESWRRDPFNPFLLADQRPVAYMKRTVMSYLDNLIAWADQLFASESREALSEATLLYVIAAEILGPNPTATTPPKHADESYDQLEPKLDAFANAMVDIENSVGGVGGSGGDGGGLPTPQTFYFKIPPNDQLLGYWTKVQDRLYKLRHCQNIQGQALQLALFDAPIDPGLLVRARAAGVDIGSVLSDVIVGVPNYRFTFLYSQALDFVNALRAYGALVLSAIEKSDSAAFTMLQQTLGRQLLADGDHLFDLQIQQQQQTIANLQLAIDLGNQKLRFNTDQAVLMNDSEKTSNDLQEAMILLREVEVAAYLMVGIFYGVPDFFAGVAGFGGSPSAGAKSGGSSAGNAGKAGTNAAKAAAAAMDGKAKLAAAVGQLLRKQQAAQEGIAEANIAIAQASTQLAGAQIALEIIQQNRVNHQEQTDNAQKQIDYLTNKFTNQDLYDWMLGQLADTYFQSYKLAYRLCRQVEKCYQFELGIQDSSFIRFGYWDSLHKGLLAGETLNGDLRRMQASYLDQNKRRFELSRFVSLASLDSTAFQQLLVTGKCDFDLPESLFDNDYPGHYNRHLVRVSVTVVYPSPGKFDNVKATLTMTGNKVRVSTDVGAGYAETPAGSDPRFVYNYAAVPQKIALGNGQDDPGLFLTAINNNLSDTRYAPFENSGAVSSWHFEMPELTNEIDLSTVGDVVFHLFYTAVDGGDGLAQAVQAHNAETAPTSGVKVFSALNDFAAPAATVANPFPVTPWQAFVATPAAGSDQVLTVTVSPAKFPAWTRGKTVAITGITVLAVSWNPGNFVLQPQAPLPNADIAMVPVPSVTEPNICGTVVTAPANLTPGALSFKLRRDSAGEHFNVLAKSDIGDVFLFVKYQVS